MLSWPLAALSRASLLALPAGVRRRRQFLQFVTSSPTVPGAGFQIEVTNFGDSPVIRVHTCMNNGGILHLPAVKEALGCLVPPDLDASLDGKRPGRKVADSQEARW